MHTPEYKLIYVITQHSELGHFIEAHAVLLNPDLSFSLKYSKVSIQSLDKSKYFFDHNDISIIKLIEQYNDEKIVKKFSKKSKRFNQFIENEFTNSLFKEYIRPYIERYLIRIIPILQSNNIPLYFKADRFSIISEKKITIHKTPAQVIFNFIRDSYEIRYFLTIKKDEQIIGLYQNNAYILTNEPAWILINNDLFSFEKNFDSKKITPFFNKQYVSIASEFEEKYFKSFIHNTIRKHEYVNGKGFTIIENRTSPVPRLKIVKDWQLNSVIVLEFKYGKQKFLSGSPESNYVKCSYSPENIVFEKVIRNIEQEKIYIDKLYQLGLEYIDDSTFKLKSQEKNQSFEYDLISWLNKNARELLKDGFDFKHDLASKNYYTGKIELIFQVEKQIDWFDIKAKVKFDNFEIPFVQLRKQLLFGKREFALPDGSVAILPEEWFETYKDVMIYAKPQLDSLSINIQHLDILKNSFPSAKEKYQNEIEEFSKQDKLALIDLPENLKAELRPYQKIGYNWLYHLSKNDFGCCLADDMGLGKTIQTLCLLQKDHEDQDSSSLNDNVIQLDLFTYSKNNISRKPSLIIMPTSLIYNWIREIRKFTPDLKCIIHSGYKRFENISQLHHYDIILSTYGVIRNDQKIFKDFSFNYLILDESQYIKNPASKIFRCIVQLKADHKIVLTGTPIENSLTDIWAQMTFLNPGLLGNLKSFQNEYIKPIEKNGDQYPQKQLKQLISPFILRRTKSQVAKELPELTETIRFCEMTEAQNSIYERKKSEIRNYILNQIDHFGVANQMINLLKGLTELRLLANHPALLLPNYEEDSGKFNEVKEQIENLLTLGHKVLIFSSFVKHLQLFRNYFETSGISFEWLSGSVQASARSRIIDNFQNNELIRLFLISIKAGGVGLNLMAADYIFILDPWWNPAVEAQAINRAHRIGQDKKVFSYKFISKNTIEEKILDLQEKKILLANEFVNNNNPLRFLSLHEIEDLLN